MRYISLFSGIEAASVAWKDLGWTTVAFAEIGAFPSAVLAERFPDVPNLGDVTKIDWSEVIGKYGAVDLIVGGSPCQSFSVAGNRTGRDGESGLMAEYIRAVQEVMPRWFVWENVPGALSVEGGAAFNQLLCEMDKLGYGLAWRILDAQFFGVPQRRRRLFLVGSLGDMSCSEVLFESESLSRDFESSKQKRESLTRRIGTGPRVCHTLKLRHTGSDNPGGGQGPLIQDDVSATIGTTNDQTLFVYSKKHRATSSDDYEKWEKSDCANTINCFDIGDKRQNEIIVMSTGQSNAEVIGGGLCTTLTCAHEQPIVCVGSDSSKPSIDDNLCGTLHVGGGAPFIAKRLSEHCALETSKA